MGTIEIPLTQGKVALIDEEDADLIEPYTWCAIKSRNTFYAVKAVLLTDGRWSTVRMHRVILGLTKGQMCDHRDRNGLNNTRKNLRQCTNSQNMANKTAMKRNKSGYKGVSWYPRTSKWRSEISVNNKFIHIGYFTDQWDAAQAYNAAALIHFGEFAVLNERDMDNRYVIGVDPGETTGIVRIEYKLLGESIESGGFWYPTGDPVVIQCDHKSVRSILAWLTAIGSVIISHERFVVSSRASRVKKAGASQITRDLNGWIDSLASERIRVVEYRAADVKPWAIPEKMAALRLTLSPEMRHARDAGKQAAYAGCHALGAPDPLSKRVALAAAYGAMGVDPGALNYGVRVTKVGGEPVTDAVITFDTTPVDATVLGGQRVASGTITGRMHENAPPPQYLPGPSEAADMAGQVPYRVGGKRLGDPHPVIRAAIDSQAFEHTRYIGLERFTGELERNYPEPPPGDGNWCMKDGKWVLL